MIIDTIITFSALTQVEYVAPNFLSRLVKEKRVYYKLHFLSRPWLKPLATKPFVAMRLEQPIETTALQSVIDTTYLVAYGFNRGRIERQNCAICYTWAKSLSSIFTITQFCNPAIPKKITPLQSVAYQSLSEPYPLP